MTEKGILICSTFDYSLTDKPLKVKNISNHIEKSGELLQVNSKFHFTKDQLYENRMYQYFFSTQGIFEYREFDFIENEKILALGKRGTYSYDPAIMRLNIQFDSNYSFKDAAWYDCQGSYSDNIYFCNQGFAFAYVNDGQGNWIEQEIDVVEDADLPGYLFTYKYLWKYSFNQGANGYSYNYQKFCGTERLQKIKEDEEVGKICQLTPAQQQDYGETGHYTVQVHTATTANYLFNHKIADKVLHHEPFEWLTTLTNKNDQFIFFNSEPGVHCLFKDSKHSILN